MKIKIDNYTFDASAKTITLTDYVSIRLDSLLLITNVTDNVIIYNFASPALGATVFGNVITLAYDTTSMSDTDDLQIFYEDTSVQPVSEITIQDLYGQLTFLLDRLEFGLMTDNAKRLKVFVESGALGTITTVTTVGTVSSVTNTVRQGDLQMQRVNEALLDTAFINGITNNIASS